MIRAATMLLALDSSILESSFHHQGTEFSRASRRNAYQSLVNLALWLESARVQISKLRSHLDTLSEMHIQFSRIGDTDGCLSLQSCVVIMLTHLALNYCLLGKHSLNTAAVDDQTLCADMVSHLVTVTQELRVESAMRRVHMYTGVRVDNPLSLRLANFNSLSHRCAG